MISESRVYGPPGTGKTTELTRLVEAAVQADEQPLVVSFTNTAAKEVSRRVNLPEDSTGTLHKFCYSFLGNAQVCEGKPKLLEEWNAYAPAYSLNCTVGLDAGDRIDASRLGDILLDSTTILRNKMIPKDQWPANAIAFFDLWSKWKDESGFVDYTDMLELALSDCPTAPGKPDVVFVDEAQDCTALQFAVLRRWAEKAGRIVMVGDDDQTIYQFAGATPEAFALSSLGPNDRILDQSYRLPFYVWENALSWIRKVPDRIDKPYFPKRSESPGSFRHCPMNWRQGDQIADLVWKVSAKYGSVMVIGACSFMLDPTRQALLRSGMPFHNPYRNIRGDWNPLRPTVGTSFAQRVASFFHCLTPDDWWTPAELKAFGSVLQAAGVFKKGMKSKLETDVFSSVSFSLIRKYFLPEAVDRILNCDASWWKDNLVNDEARRKAAFPIRVSESLGPAFLSAEPFVTLGTIHSVKGAEADVVIIFPDLSQEGILEWTGKGKSSIRRLMYVGITRAREGVFVCQPASRFACDL